jgi:hypothetical protein
MNPPPIKRGRPKLSPEKKVGTHVHYKVTMGQHQLLKKAAKRTSVPLWAREAALEKAGKV